MNGTSNYKGTTFGPLKIPYVPLVNALENPYAEKDVEIAFSPELFEIPDNQIMGKMEKSIEVIKAKKEAERTLFYNGPQESLTRYTLDDRNHSLKLFAQPTNFFTREFTNNSLDDDLVWEMVLRRGADYKNLVDGLANPIGTQAVVFTKSGGVVIEKRGNISQYPFLYGVPSGFVEPNRDKHNPFDTVKDVLRKQLGIDEAEHIELLGLGRAADDRHVELLYRVLTDYSADEILQAPIPDKLEKRNVVKFTPEVVAPYLVETVGGVPKGAIRRGDMWVPHKSPAWVPAQAMDMIYSLVKEYGYERVKTAIDDAFRSPLKPVA